MPGSRWWRSRPAAATPRFGFGQDLGAAFAQIADELHSQYLLGFAPPKRDGKVHDIDVRVATRGLKPRARKSYVAPKERVALSATNTIILDDRHIEERFVRAPGPGGQNVNKVATTVELRFNVEVMTTDKILSRTCQ